MIKHTAPFFLLLLSLVYGVDASSVFEQLAKGPTDRPMIVEFKEVRHFQLKKHDFHFSGIMRFHPEHGMSIEYLEPRAKIFILSKNGLLIRESDKPDTAAPEQAIPVVKVFLDLLALDQSALNESFKIKEESKADGSWTLTMFPKLTALKRALQWIEAEGVGSELRSIRVQNGSKRWRIISYEQPPNAWEPEDGEMEKYF